MQIKDANDRNMMCYAFM